MSGLWPHQQQISDLLAQGKNVILQSPTGSGKTRAALDHFLYELRTPLNRASFPRRCIYSVPMRVLAKQFYLEYQEIVRRYNQQFNLDMQIVARTQTGEQPEDPELTANLIFATIDQTLSSYLLAPYSLGRRRGNVNAGAVMSSYLVFDEFHLYDPASTLPTTLFMLKSLRNITPFVLMTATFSTVMLEELGELLNAEVFPKTAAQLTELEGLPSQRKRRFYRVVEQPLSARTVWTTHEQRSMAICNTVDRARKLYDDLTALVPPDVEVILLHSRFLRDERNGIETRIRDLFGKDADCMAGNAIVVATQAIEVGVDMSCTALHTELAPANAVIQRAGRCARYEGETGTVYIYPLTINPDDPESPLDLTDPDNAAPYKSQRNLFPGTLNAFLSREGERQFTFADEQAVITEVHNAQDAQILSDIRAGGRGYASAIFAVQRGDDDARHFIRDIQQQNIIIHADPNSLLTLPQVSPLDQPAFGLHPGTLQKYVKQWQEVAEALDTWSVKILFDYGADRTDKEETASQNNHERYQWHDIKSPSDVRFAPLTVVNPLLATYDERRGFVPDQGGGWQTPIPEPKAATTAKPNISYELETYADHIHRVYEAFLENWWESEWAAKQLETRFGWQVGSVQWAAELAVLLHDVGKLSVGWQKWVREYQAKVAALEDDIHLEVQPGQAYAHTHLKNEAHREIERSMGKRPWHAVEGAVSIAPIIAAELENDNLLCAVFGAVARHHSPYSDAHQPYTLIRNARQHIAVPFSRIGTAPDLRDLMEAVERENPTELMPNPDTDAAAFLTYLLIVRALRRADVAGTIAGSVKL
jgi:CRISPR-associated endonuclease/helicase Cas3